MATISFERNVTIKDAKKVKEVLTALSNGTSSFVDVAPAKETKLPKDAEKIWFKR